MNNIYEIYRHRCHEQGDVNEHLPMLCYLSLISCGVAEFGVARGISSSALIAGQDSDDHISVGWYEGYDPNEVCAAEIQRLKEACRNNWSVKFTPKASVAVPAIKPVDLLFIDSVHTEETVRKELELHLSSVRRFVALHDTVTYGEQGEIPGTRGLIYGMGLLLTDQWQKVYDSPRNNGLTVFERKLS